MILSLFAGRGQSLQLRLDCLHSCEEIRHCSRGRRGPRQAADRGCYFRPKRLASTIRKHLALDGTQFSLDPAKPYFGAFRRDLCAGRSLGTSR
ncbi:hypothetical protein AQZ52_03245 [Novosphingobium fuchskuhlense]|uniref:Uncharacterized protein n=1 Tax=Novosphingobium fuchskuhlense TaxID=1117702 RepID=A0A124JVI4_9SPHN|nr:hypothetical protein AQZ52_03245 [Novosphingobium fuchskuhlense]